MAQAVIRAVNNTVYQVKFAGLANHLEFYELNPQTAVIREAIKICLGNPGIDAESFATS